MARNKDPMMEDVRRIKRRLSQRLLKALRQGRLSEERIAIEREAEQVYRESTNGSRNGNGKHRR